MSTSRSPTRGATISLSFTRDDVLKKPSEKQQQQQQQQPQQKSQETAAYEQKIEFLRRIQNESTFTTPIQRTPYTKEFLKEFYKSVYTPSKKEFYRKQRDKFFSLDKMYKQLCPRQISFEDFWQRYEYRCIYELRQPPKEQKQGEEKQRQEKQRKERSKQQHPKRQQQSGEQSGETQDIVEPSSSSGSSSIAVSPTDVKQQDHLMVAMDDVKVDGNKQPAVLLTVIDQETARPTSNNQPHSNINMEEQMTQPQQHQQVESGTTSTVLKTSQNAININDDNEMPLTNPTDDKTPRKSNRSRNSSATAVESNDRNINNNNKDQTNNINTNNRKSRSRLAKLVEAKKKQRKENQKLKEEQEQQEEISNNNNEDNNDDESHEHQKIMVEQQQEENNNKDDDDDSSDEIQKIRQQQLQEEEEEEELEAGTNIKNGLNDTNESKAVKNEELIYVHSDVSNGENQKINQRHQQEENHTKANNDETANENEDARKKELAVVYTDENKENDKITQQQQPEEGNTTKDDIDATNETKDEDNKELTEVVLVLTGKEPSTTIQKSTLVKADGTRENGMNSTNIIAKDKTDKVDVYYDDNDMNAKEKEKCQCNACTVM